MPTPKVCVLRAPGTNCDVETAFAFEHCGAKAERVHLFRLLEHPRLLDQYQILCVPGGFSYGDDIGAGVIFASQMRGHLGEAIGDFLRADKLVLGICNGFQTLLKAGILPGGAEEWNAAERTPAATLTWNTNGKYTTGWVRLKVASPPNVFLRGMEELDAPFAHAEGRLVVRDEAVLHQWRDRGQIALRYTSRNGQGHVANEEELLPFPDNPNGAVANIAGLGDRSGRILGLMPHPERFLFGTQHPQWTRLGLTGDGDGLKVFRNAVEYFSDDFAI